MIMDVDDRAVAEVDARNRVTLKASAIHTYQVIAMEGITAKCMDAVDAFERHGDAGKLRNDLREAADPATYAGLDVLPALVKGAPGRCWPGLSVVLTVFLLMPYKSVEAVYMPKGRMSGALPRECPVCHKEYTPVRRAQVTCKECRYTVKALVIKADLREREGRSFGLDLRSCEKCGKEYKPGRPDQRTCGAVCPGKPDFELICANPDCLSPDRKFLVLGNSRGKGNQQYCSEKCRDHVARIRQGQRFRRYDGMAREEFISQGEAQSWRCVLCRIVPEPDKRRRLLDELPYLEVDHCHETGKRRDLLCGACNKGLGMFKDDPEVLRAAASYLERWRSIHAGVADNSVI